MLRMFILIPLLTILSSFAMVDRGVAHPEPLFVNQQTPVWCWAAMSEGMRNFYKFDYWPQALIVDSNPDRDVRDRMGFTPPFNILIPLEKHQDYLLAEVLTNEYYQAKVAYFSEKKTTALLNQGHPVIISSAGHVSMIYAYIVIQGEKFYKVFDPFSHFLFKNPFSYHSQYEYENIFGEPHAYMVYLESKP